MNIHKSLYSVMDLKDVEFPRCVEMCALADYFGVSECENMCEWKFREFNSEDRIQIINGKQRRSKYVQSSDEKDVGEQGE